MEPYRPPSPPTPNPWIYAGRASELIDIAPTAGNGNTKLSSTKPVPKTKEGEEEDIFASPEITTPCKILQLASPDFSSSSSASSSATTTTKTTLFTPDTAQHTLGFHPQILLFRYRGQIHAIDHSCPHRNFPLSRGSLYDIEDFGVVLSTGIACPKHGWSFDVVTGESDRGGYKLGVWEVEVRGGENGFGEVEEEVWVRRKEGRRRIG